MSSDSVVLVKIAYRIWELKKSVSGFHIALESTINSRSFVTEF